jgi:DNA repair protein RadC
MRPRERYLSQGSEDVGDVELLALLLGTGAAGRTTLAIAADLVGRFGGLRGVARAEPARLRCVPGVGEARAVRLHAALELGRRAHEGPERPAERVASPAEAAALLMPRLRHLTVEELHAIYVDRRNRVMGQRRLTRGSDAFTVVDPRQVFRPAVELGAAGVLMAHNHPSGDPTPSAMDREVTRRTASAGQVLGVRLLDHLVIGGDRWVSLAEQGCLPGFDGAPSAVATGP